MARDLALESTPRCLAAVGGALAFASALGPWTSEGVGSSVSGRELASLVVSGTTAHWVPPVIGVLLFLIPLCGGAALIGAGIPGRTGRLVAAAAASLATTLGLMTAAALRWAPLTTPGWGAMALVAAVACWVIAGALVGIERRRSDALGLRLVVWALLAAAIVLPASRAEASPSREDEARDRTCESSEASPGRIPVVVVLADDDDREAVTRRLAGFDVVERYLLDQPSPDSERQGWKQLPEEDPAAALDALEPGSAIVVVPVGSWPTGEVERLKNETGPAVFVADQVPDPTATALRDRVEATYADRLASSSSVGSVQAEREGDAVTVTAESPPGLTVELSDLTVASGGVAVATCPGTVALPAKIELPEGAGKEGLTITAAQSFRAGESELDAVPVTIAVGTADSGSTTSTSTTEPGSDPSDPSADQGPEREDSEVGVGTDSASGDDGGGSGVPVVVVLLLLVLAGGGGYLVARRGREGGAPAPGPDSWTGAPAPVAPAPVAPAVAHQRSSVPAPGWTAAVRAASDVRLDDVGVHRLAPLDVPEGRVWADDTDRSILLGCWLEKKPELGEDAEPTLRVHETGRGLIGVYDGTGGSGARVARRLRNGTELSGAYVAARLAREVAETWFTEQVDAQSPLAADGLTRRVGDALRDEAAGLGGAAGMKGSLHRVLPTTIAAIAFDDALADRTSVDVLWAGDSRAYVLTAEQGLQVLSVDDTRETDALALIRNDQPMTNLLSADRSFTINQRHLGLARPSLLLVATDGCFGYVRTPAHFEYLVLRTLLESTDVATWGVHLLRSLHGFTADDASLALVGLGFESFAALQRSMAPRCEYLHREHWLPFEQADERELDHLRDASWEAYRGGYHAQVLAPEQAR